jgi:hypothetical protein
VAIDVGAVVIVEGMEREDDGPMVVSRLHRRRGRTMPRMVVVCVVIIGYLVVSPTPLSTTSYWTGDNMMMGGGDQICGS